MVSVSRTSIPSTYPPIAHHPQPYAPPVHIPQQQEVAPQIQLEMDYSHFQHLIKSNIKISCSVLELGCGNSQLCDEMFKDGIVDIMCVHLSSVAVDKMQSRLLSKGYKEIKVVQADMLDLPFSNESFDVVVEKGTMPHFRRPLFKDPEFTWSMEYNTFGDGFHYDMIVTSSEEEEPEVVGRITRSRAREMAKEAHALIAAEDINQLEAKAHIFNISMNEEPGNNH